MPDIKENVALAPYTTFKIGGLARYFSEAKSTDEVVDLCEWAKKNLANLPAGRQVFVLGGGSNILISDKGFDGLVIRLRIADCASRVADIEAGAGVPLAKIVGESVSKSLTGLEWAIGIPGTVGGAINGNAGAFNQSMAGVVEGVRAIDLLSGNIEFFNKKECNFNYRNSVFKRNSNFIILSAVLKLEKGNEDDIKNKFRDFAKQRSESTPAGCSAGCFFKNIEWLNVSDKENFINKFSEIEQFRDKPKISIGFLIGHLNLKGKKIGGAMVSDKHANFIINNGNAKSDDVLNLVNLIKKNIFDYYGLNIEEEVVII